MTQSFNIRERFILEMANREEQNAAFDIIEATESDLLAKGLDIGVALNQGPVIAGEIGSEGRCEFTVIGNTVNIAARLEGLNRSFGTKLLVTEVFAADLKETLATQNPKGSKNIRGIDGDIEIIELKPAVS